MFTNKDIEYKTIYVVNCIKERNIKVQNGELLLEDSAENKTLTKLPFQKILALFIIGPISITTPLIDKCKRYNVALVVMRTNLRPVFVWADSAEANYLLRKRQYEFDNNNIGIAKKIILNKISNQLTLLKRTRKKDDKTTQAIVICEQSVEKLYFIDNYNDLMGLEGIVAKMFFAAYFQDNQWRTRKPRAKTDAINTTLDIGYTILFNFIETFARMFGFDLYIGVYHRLWFKRKSLICDLIEPFRCIVDAQVRKSFHLGQFKTSDFLIVKNEYVLKHEKSSDYYRVFFDALIIHKSDIFKYIQCYYRCFMRQKEVDEYPQFKV